MYEYGDNFSIKYVQQVRAEHLEMTYWKQLPSLVSFYLFTYGKHFEIFFAIF